MVKQRLYTHEEAAAAVKKLGIRTMKEYEEGRKQNVQLPSSPDRVYRTDWISWEHFLGKGSK